MTPRAKALLKSIPILCGHGCHRPCRCGRRWPPTPIGRSRSSPASRRAARPTPRRVSIGEKLQVAWGKPVVVENVTGAGGNLAADRVAKSAPDGYTLLMAGNASIVVNLNLYEKLPYDPVKELMPVSQVSMTPNVLAVHPDVAAKSVAELVALARAQPDGLTYAHGGIGISQHLAGELFKHIGRPCHPARRLSRRVSVMPDLMAGRVRPVLLQHHQRAAAGTRGQAEGAGRHVAASARRRRRSCRPCTSPGFPGFDATAWFGLMAPAGTPPAIVDKLHRADGARRSPRPTCAPSSMRWAWCADRQLARRVRRRDQHGDPLLGEGHQGHRPEAEIAGRWRKRAFGRARQRRDSADDSSRRR